MISWFMTDYELAVALQVDEYTGCNQHEVQKPVHHQRLDHAYHSTVLEDSE